MEEHSFTLRISGKPYCQNCGLVALNNSFTRWAIDKGCLNEYHSQYQNKRRRLTNDT